MIERAPFGATGHESSRAIFGAAALGNVSKHDADKTLELLLEHGINHIDVAADYGDAELRIATWLRRHEGEFFVATKTASGPTPRRASRSAARSTASASTRSIQSSSTTSST
jgi:aryl-alcohol dehydrogenase-like predicted oxidoreductase